MEDVPSHPEDEDYSQGTHEPRRCVRQISLQIEIKEAQRHDGEAARSAHGGPKSTRSQHEKNKSAKAQANQGRQETDPTHGRIGNDEDGCNAEGDRGDKAPGLAHEIAFLLFEGPQLARIGDGVADIAQGLKQLTGARHRRVIFDERLLMRETDRHLVNAGQPTESFFDSPGAERAMQSADPRPYLPAVWSRRRLFAPRLDCGITRHGNCGAKSRRRDQTAGRYGRGSADCIARSAPGLSKKLSVGCPALTRWRSVSRMSRRSSNMTRRWRAPVNCFRPCAISATPSPIRAS